MDPKINQKYFYNNLTFLKHTLFQNSRPQSFTLVKKKT